MIAPTDPRTPRVVLVGPPGAGKSTIGRKLARELGVDLYDTDAGIERETGRTIPEIFAEDGEPEFRRIEERVVRRAILAERGVVSLGGGAVLSANTRALLRNRTVVYLEISVAEGLRRTGASNQRPLLNGDDPGAKYRELMRTRRPLYREVATVRVRTDGRSPSRVVRMILSRLGIDPATADPEPGKSGEAVTPAAPGSSRSRARRRARARAAARRRAAATSGSVAESAAPATETTTVGRPGVAAQPVTEPATSSSGEETMRSSAHHPTAATSGPAAAAEQGAAASGNSAGDAAGESATTGRRRRPRRRRSQSGSRPAASGSAQDAQVATGGTPRGSADGADIARTPTDHSGDGANVTGIVAAGRSITEPDHTGAVRPGDGSGEAAAEMAGRSATGSDGTGVGTPAPADRAPRRSRRSGRRRGTNGSQGSSADGTPPHTRPVHRENPDAHAPADGDRPAAPAAGQTGTGAPAPSGNRSRRARARRARNGGSGARGGATGTRGNAPSVRGGGQNARGGASKQTARTESEQQS